jgi:hypothetical protein
MHRGTTPLSNPRFDWIAEGVTCKGPYVIELAGYVTVETSSPTEGLGCTDRIIELQPK